MTDEEREQAIIGTNEKGEKVYSHQRLVRLYMETEGLSLEDAIEETDFDMAFYHIELEEHD